MTAEYVLGIDLGTTGAVAIFRRDGRWMEVVDLPVMEGAIGKKARTILNALAFQDLLFTRGIGSGSVAYLERVHAMPFNGAIATFSQGHSLATVMAVLALCHIPCHQLQPTAWKKAVGLPLTGDPKRAKEIARSVAIQLYPQAAASLGLKKHHNRADAMLIGRYGVSLTG